MKISRIPFSQLQEFLEKLGFTGGQDDKGWRYEHASSDTIFLFRPYKPKDRVYELDLFVIRSQLTARGFMTDEGFEEQLEKSPA